MTPDLILGLEVISIFAIACIILCPLLLWILPDPQWHQPES